MTATVSRAEVQAWADSLGERESTMLAMIVDESSYAATIEALDGLSQFLANLANEHANASRYPASRTVREVISTVLGVKRDMQEALAKRRAGMATQ